MMASVSRPSKNADGCCVKLDTDEYEYSVAETQNLTLTTLFHSVPLALLAVSSAYHTVQGDLSCHIIVLWVGVNGK